MIENIIAIVKITLVNGATSATPERSFSLARRLKTWNRSNMKQKRFNSLAILNAHQEIVDDLSLENFTNDFIASSSTKRNNFGKF